MIATTSLDQKVEPTFRKIQALNYTLFILYSIFYNFDNLSRISSALFTICLPLSNVFESST